MIATISTLAITKLYPLLLTAVGFGLLITVHEFGHFIFAKMFGIGVPVFSIGFGPSLIKKKIGSTEFRLSLIPLGGYCAIQGMSDPEAGMVDTGSEPENPAYSYESKAFWQKLLVLLGGILFNLVFAYGAFITLYVGTRPKMKTAFVVSSVPAQSPAEQGGIKAGDIITGYNGMTFGLNDSNPQEQLQEFLQTIAASPQKKMTLTLATTERFAKIRRVRLGETEDKRGFLGVAIEMQTKPIEGEFESDTLSSAITKGVALTHFYIKSTVSAITNMFCRRSLDSVGGPLAMFSQTFKSAQNGLRSLIQFMGTISVSLALMNLIPIGALDGGQLLFLLLEGIIRRPLPQRLKEGMIIASWFLFIALVLVLSYRDILRFIGA